ncbi:MAG: response regulator transcription factor [Acidobacteria bacterium]|nr:response regulator transcription factor [Acidobacteriota bacterium]
MPRILIVDDHELVRHGMRALLQESPIQYEIGEARNGTEAVNLLRAQHWDLLILDLSLPDRAGMEMLRDVKEQFSNLPVLICSGHHESDYAVRALRAGASAYVPKSSAADELLVAVDKAMRGKRYIQPALAERLAEEMVGGDLTSSLHDKLTDRELDVLRLIGAGKSNGEIGKVLFISIKTVSTHRANILRKLGMQSNADLIRYAIRNNLVG